MAKWNDAIRSIALEMLDGEEVSARISRLARWYKVDLHSATIAVEECADLLRD